MKNKITILILVIIIIIAFGIVVFITSKDKGETKNANKLYETKVVDKKINVKNVELISNKENYLYKISLENVSGNDLKINNFNITIYKVNSDNNFNISIALNTTLKLNETRDYEVTVAENLNDIDIDKIEYTID